MILIFEKILILWRCQSPNHHRWHTFHIRGSPHPWVWHFTRFPNLRKPSMVNVPFLSVWWAFAQYGSLRTCSLHIKRTKKYVLTFRFGFPSAFRWNRCKHVISWQQNHHLLWFCFDCFFFFCIFLQSFQDYCWIWNGKCQANTKDNYIYCVWKFTSSICLRIGSLSGNMCVGLSGWCVIASCFPIRGVGVGPSTAFRRYGLNVPGVSLPGPTWVITHPGWWTTKSKPLWLCTVNGHCRDRGRDDCGFAMWTSLIHAFKHILSSPEFWLLILQIAFWCVLRSLYFVTFVNLALSLLWRVSSSSRSCVSHSSHARTPSSRWDLCSTSMFMNKKFPTLYSLHLILLDLCNFLPSTWLSAWKSSAVRFHSLSCYSSTEMTLPFSDMNVQRQNTHIDLLHFPRFDLISVCIRLFLENHTVNWHSAIVRTTIVSWPRHSARWRVSLGSCPAKHSTSRQPVDG